MKRFIKCLILLYMGNAVYAQNSVNFLTPTVADFVKYGNQTPSFYTGQIGLSIPLLEGKDNDFKIPVALNYNSIGFMPGRPSGMVGLNWYLSAGGSITRKVNGSFDENLGLYDSSIRVLKGFFTGTRTTPINKNTAFNFNSGYVDIFHSGYVDEQYIWNMGYDYEPDEFSFNFMGYSGKFFFSNDGNVKVISEDSIRIDYSNFALQSINRSQTLPANSTFVLTTPDGYKYHFGGIPRNLEYSFQLYGIGGVSAHNRPTIHTWNLTKVVAPNGKELNITYLFHDPAVLTTDPWMNERAYNSSADHHFILNRHNNSTTNVNVETTSAQYGLSGLSSSSMTDQNPIFSVTKTCYIEKIETENFVINFSYSPKPDKYYSNTTNIYNQQNLQLDTVTLKQSNQDLLNNVIFNYVKIGSSPLHFLNSLTESGKQPYKFEYYNSGVLPPTETRGIDHWGFWNGGISTATSSRLIPSVSWTAAGDETITSSERNADTSYCRSALLKKIIYPTGGYSVFHYEGNDYSQRLERKSASAFLPSIVTISGLAGGARIKRIQDFDGNAILNIREFKYVKNYITDTSSTTSSGFLFDYPRYGMYLEFGDGNGGILQRNIQLRASSFHNNYNTSENFISYSEITEITNGIGYKVYKYSNYISNPDIADYNEHDNFPELSNEASNLNLYKNYIGYKLGDRSRDRGKLLFTGSYDSNRKIVKSEQSFYQPANTSKFSVAILNSGSYAQSYKLYEDMPKLMSTKSSTHSLVDGSESVSSIRNFSYDNEYRLLSKEVVKTSKNDSLITNYKYSYDFPSSQPYVSMLNNHIFLPIIEKYIYKNIIDSTRLLSADFNIYKDWGNGIFAPEISESKIGSGMVEVQTVYHGYDNRGNILTLSKGGGPLTNYIWGYNGQYPIAEVKNAGEGEFFYEDFEENGPLIAGIVIFPHSGLRAYNGSISLSTYFDPSHNGKSYLLDYYSYDGTDWVYQQANYTGQVISGIIDDIRIYPIDAQMTTYTYKPLVGMTSMTDASGRTTYYEYDNFQRLKKIKDLNKDIMKNYDYHYRPSN